jgi:RimJ/RimL family protein N-acetyltransferase/predicted CoA-binding protein
LLSSPADGLAIPAAAEPVDVILRDGTTLRLRAPESTDAGALGAFFAGLSKASLYQRFHGLRAVDAALVEPLLEPDWVERGALLGTLGDRVVAVANFVRLRDPAVAEAAFVVADDLQGRGLGTRLLEQLAARAAAVGVHRFVATVLADNRRMLDVFTGAGFEVVRELDRGEVEVRFPIAATEGFRASVEARDHVAIAASLEPFFAPSAVAVVGASARRGSIGGELFRNILAGDFSGAAYPINRGGAPVAGVRAYGTIGEVPEPVDLAVICLPGAQVLDAAAAALATGVRALCVISSGFAETGSAGRDRQEQLLALVRSHGAWIVGTNFVGFSSE